MILRMTATVLALLLGSSVLHAENSSNVRNGLYTGCTALREDTPRLGSEIVLAQGLCLGIIEALMVSGKEFAPPLKFCPSENVTLGQAIDVVVNFIERNPSELHRKFATLAHMSFLEAFPCPEA